MELIGMEPIEVEGSKLLVGNGPPVEEWYEKWMGDTWEKFVGDIPESVKGDIDKIIEMMNLALERRMKCIILEPTSDRQPDGSLYNIRAIHLFRPGESYPVLYARLNVWDMRTCDPSSLEHMRDTIKRVEAAAWKSRRCSVYWVEALDKVFMVACILPNTCYLGEDLMGTLRNEGASQALSRAVAIMQNASPIYYNPEFLRQRERGLLI